MATFQPPTLHEEFISEEDAYNIKKTQVKHYAYRNGVLKRAPKIEWFRHTPLRYHWGQHKSNDLYATKFPEWMENIAATLPEPVNHAIVTRYHDGMKTYAPWHADKAIETGRKTGCMQKELDSMSFRWEILENFSWEMKPLSSGAMPSRIAA